MYLGLDYPFVYFNQFRHLCLFLLRKLFVMSMPAKLRGLAVLGLTPWSRFLVAFKEGLHCGYQIILPGRQI